MINNINIVAAQINLLVGDIEGNAARVVEAVKKAHIEKNADIIVFPELTLTSYPPEDLLFRQSLYRRIKKAFHFVRKNALKDIAVLIGYPYHRNGRIYNRAALLYNGKCLARYSKQKLPNYNVFDEKRYFSPGHRSCIIPFKGIKLGLLICEDLWRVDPIIQAKREGAEIILSLNASPYHHDKAETRESLLSNQAKANNIPIVYTNLIGGQDDLVFDGGSMAVDADGQITHHAPYFKEHLLNIACTITEGGDLKFMPSTLPKPAPNLENIYEALKLGVRDYVTKNSFKKVLIGLSGGIDSALTLAIAADALGADAVTAVLMPSQYTAQMSVEDAKAQTELLSVSHKIIPIDSLYQSSLATLDPHLDNSSFNITHENLQARIRGMLLMALSNDTGAMVLTTGNKSEMAVGYATLYGDMCGGLAVLKDVSKTLVYQLANYRNSLSPVIPQRVIDREPSAELRENQTDEDSLPPYEVVDKILHLFVEQDKSIDEIVRAGLNRETVEHIVKRINQNEYKRRQSAPGIRITQCAFGKDRRYPITSGSIIT